MSLRDPWLAGTFVLAAGLRLYGLDHGLPHVYNPDEANIIARALSLAQDPNPHYFLYPSFFFYVLFALLGGLYVGGRLTGHYQSREAFAERFFEDPSAFYLAGRALGVVSALLTIVLTYSIARRSFGRTAARAAALFVAVAFFHVRDSHYLKHDVPVGLLVLLAVGAFSAVLNRGTLRSHLQAGAAMGVAFATHYYTVFLGPVYLLCHWAGGGFSGAKKLLAGAAVAGAVFFVLSPFVVLDLPTAIEHMRENREVVVDRSLEAGAFFLPSLPDYLEFLAVQGLGILLCALAVGGFYLLIRRGVGCTILWAVFPIVFLLFISYTHFAGRYLNPILPFLAIAAGVGVEGIRRRAGGVAAAGVALVACLQPLYFDLHMLRLFAGEDTRSIALRWIEDNVPHTESIALQSYSVPLPQSEESLEESLAANDALGELDRRGKFFHLAAVARDEKPAYDLFFVGQGDEKNRIYFSYEALNRTGLAPLRSRGVTLVVLRHPPEPPPREVAAFFRRVAEQGRLVRRVSPFTERSSDLRPYLDNEDWPPLPGLAHKGPLVEIWSLAER